MVAVAAADDIVLLTVLDMLDGGVAAVLPLSVGSQVVGG
jgi:hypothetical protein